ncbi:MAG: glycosyltransferase family 39 protein [Acidobacteriota bacterium]
MKRSRLFQVVAVAILSAVYTAVRMWRSSASCLWFDEIFSVHAAEHTWGTIIAFVAKDLIHPPLFYFFLKIWISIGGESLSWLRLLPVAFAVAAIVPFLYLCRELRLAVWSQLVAFLLFAVNGSLIKYSQEVRMYSLMLCLSLFSMWLFVRYFHKGKGLAPLIIVNILLIYSHYFGWFVALSEVAAIVIFQRIKIRAILIMLGACAASYIPWMIAVWTAVREGSNVGQNIGWMQRPQIIDLVKLVVDLAEPFYFPASNAEPFSVFAVSVPIIIVVAGGLVVGVINDRARESERFETKRLLAIFILLPVLSAFLASWFLPYSIWGTRHLVVVFVPAFLLVGAVIGRIKIAGLKIAVIAILLLISGYAFAIQARRETPTYIWCAWEPLAADVTSSGVEKLYVFEDLVAYHFWFALHEKGSRVEVAKIRSVDGVTEDPAYFLPRGFDDIATIDLPEADAPRFWIAYRGERIDESKGPLSAFVQRGYHIADRKVYAASGDSAILILLEK